MTLLQVYKRYFRKSFTKLVAFTAIAVSVQLFGLLMPYLIGNFIDGLSRSQSIHFILKYCVLFFGLSVLSLLLNYISNILYVNLQMSSVYQFNTDMIFYVQQTSILSSEGKNLTQLNQQINTDVNVLIMFALGFCRNFVVNILILPIVVSVCIFLNQPVTSALLVFSLLYILLFSVTKKSVYQHDFACKEAQSNFFSRMYEQIANIRFLKENGAERFFRSRLLIPYKVLYKATMSNQKTLMLFSNLDSIIGFGLQIALYFFGGCGILSGQFSIGLFVMFSSYFSLVMSCLRYFLNYGKEYEGVSASLHRLQNVKAIPIEKTGVIKVDDCQVIKVEHLSFCYEGATESVLQDICCSFPKGQAICLVGHNGAGKSTLLGLMLGLYNDRLATGNLQYDGQNITELDTTYLREHLISVVSQSPYIFEGTLWDNLLLDVPTQAQRLRVTELARTFHLPEALLGNSPLQSLSNGEKQKVSIIRAFLRDTPVMIFDEPTSSLDEQSTKALTELIAQTKQNKIVIIVSHDDFLASHCDSIVHFS